jgi:hypothetical protein
MIPQQALMNDALSPHTPSSLPANADEPVEWLWQHRLAAGTLAMLSGVDPKTENLVPGRRLCRIRRMSALRPTRQDAQMNDLSTLSIFMKQTTYLATLPNPNLKANECVYDGAVRDIGSQGTD